MSTERTDYFGVCPQCKKSDGYVNFGRDHWFICEKHRVKWWVGSNLFSGWRDETEEEQCREWKEKGFDQFATIVPV